jgi:hypothetical protein
MEIVYESMVAHKAPDTIAEVKRKGTGKTKVMPTAKTRKSGPLTLAERMYGVK